MALFLFEVFSIKSHAKDFAIIDHSGINGLQFAVCNHLREDDGGILQVFARRTAGHHIRESGRSASFIWF